MSGGVTSHLKQALLSGACQFAVTVLTDSAGKAQLEVLITQLQTQVTGASLVLVDILIPAPTDRAGVRNQQAPSLELAHVVTSDNGLNAASFFGQFLRGWGCQIRTGFFP